MTKPLVKKPTSQDTVLQETVINNVNVTKKSPSNAKISNTGEIEFLVMDMLELLQDEHSKGFYRLVAQKCPREMIYATLSEVKDLKLTHRLKKSAGHAFTKIIRERAKDASIELQLKKT